MRTLILIACLVLAACFSVAAQSSANKFGTPYARVTAVSADAAVAVNDDVVTATAATTPVTITLYTPAGNFAQDNLQGGIVRVVNSASSKNIVVVSPAAGSISGATTLYPGQSALYESDGIGTWYCTDAPPLVGQLQVSVSSADILALNATPKELIPAPGAGKVVVVEHILVKAVTTSTQYANGGALEFRYTNASGAKVTADVAAAVITAGAGTSYTGVAGVTTSLTHVANAAIVVDNATAAFITGTGTAVVTVKYRVVTP